MSKNITLEEAQRFLHHQSKTSYSNVFLLEIHRRIFEITKLAINLNYSNNYSNTLLILEKIIKKLNEESDGGSSSYEITPLTPNEKNTINDISISLSTKKVEAKKETKGNYRYDSFQY